jgi:tetratricopeptide (TPR) repeat protein
MTRSLKAVSISFLLLLLVSTALSQQLGPTNEKELQRQREQLQAISMIKRSADDAPLWDNKKAAVQVLTDAADLLWDEAPAQGIKWLKKAWELIEQVSGSPKDEKLKEFFTRSEQSDLRAIVLSVARRHDPELAERFLKQLSQKESSEKKDRGAFDDRTARSEQLLQMAQQSVESSPEVAFTLAEKSLADGVSYSLQNVLTSLRKKNVELANRLFDLALARFSRTGADPSEAQVLAGYLFQSGFTFSANPSGQTILVMNPAQQNLPAVAASEPQRAKSFLVAVYEVLLARPVMLDSAENKQRAQQLLVLGNRLARPFRAFAPELVQSAQGFLAHLQRQLSPDDETTGSSETTGPTAISGDTTKSLTIEEIYEKRISELEDKAEKQSNPLARKLAYAEAALATKPEDYNRARRIAEKIDDDNLRVDVVSFLLYRGALFLVEKAEIEKAIELAPQISDILRRSVVKIAIAQRLLSSNPEKSKSEESTLTQQRAFDLLSDMDRDFKNEEPSTNGAKILLAKTAVLAKLDHDQALISLESSVQMINKLDSFDLRDGGAPNLGLGISETSGATVERPRFGFDFRSAIDPLISTNFEQVAATAERFTAKEVRGVGCLEVAKLYLRKNNYLPRKASIRSPQ